MLDLKEERMKISFNAYLKSGAPSAIHFSWPHGFLIVLTLSMFEIFILRFS